MHRNENERSSAVLPVLSAIHAEARAYVGPPLRRVLTTSRLLLRDAASPFGREVAVEEPVGYQWHRVLRGQGVSRPLTNGEGTRVLIATGYGMSAFKLALESVMAVGLELRGAQVKALVCDRSLSACEFNRFGNHLPSPGEFGPRLGPRARLAICDSCTRGAEDVFGPLGIEMLRLSAFENDDDQSRLSAHLEGVEFDSYRRFSYSEVAVGEHAFSSVLRSTLRGTVEDTPESRWLFRRYLLASMRLVDQFERLIETERPERVVAIHGVYLVHGTICDVARKHGIPVVVFGVPYRQGTIWASHEDTYHRTLVSEPTEVWEHDRLTRDQDEVLDAYVDSKRGGGRDYVSYHPSPVENRDQVVRELGLDPAKPVIGMFTNVIWDAQIYYDHNAFDNMLEWVFGTIRYFASRPDLQLVIRIHPAEVKGGLPTNQPILPEIRAAFRELPSNVRVIPPESDISSYTLAEMSTAALIYGTKMGLEIALRGIPVVVAGETFSRNKGFTYDISSAEEYFQLLDRIETLPRSSPEVVERARRYAYYLYFRRMIDFPLVSVTDPHQSAGVQLEFDDVDALRPGASAGLDVLCDGILRGTPFMVADTEAATVGATT
jgi:hypothetical protein